MTSIVLFSCGKEGPAGPPGRDGREGREGRNGRDGLDGRDGLNGAQISCEYFDIAPNEWKSDGSFGMSGYYVYAERDFSAITTSVINQGAIMGYLLWGKYDHQLPYLDPFLDNGNDVTRIIRYDLQEGKIGFIVQDTDFKTLLPPFSTDTVTFKVVIIS